MLVVNVIVFFPRNHYVCCHVYLLRCFSRTFKAEDINANYLDFFFFEGRYLLIVVLIVLYKKSFTYHKNIYKSLISFLIKVLTFGALIGTFICGNGGGGGVDFSSVLT